MRSKNNSKGLGVRVIVSDTSCLIDLRKAELLEAFVRTPYERLIPYTLFEDELVHFTEDERRLLAGGMVIVDSPAEQVQRAIELRAENTALTENDCFAYALAEATEDSILLTGDNRLRTLAERNGLEVHGVLWALDIIHAAAAATAGRLVAALELFRDDETVHVPPTLITRALVRYRRLAR
jgi:predicted nucleic acid-binding protein